MIDKLIRAINGVALVMGGMAILAMTLLGGADIIATFILGKPLNAVFEATQTFMVIAVFLGLGAVHIHRSHICVDVGYDMLPKAGKRISELITLLLMLAFFSALASRAWTNALQSWKVGEYSSGIIAFPIYPAKFALAVGCTIAVLCCVVDLLRGGRFRKPTSLEAREHGDLAAS